MFGDIPTKVKAFARKHKDLINPIIGRVRAGAHSGIDKLSAKAREKIDDIIKPIEGEGVRPKRRGRPKKGTGVIGDVLKGIIGVTGLGVVKPKQLRKGKGVLTNIIKAVAPSAIDAISSAATSVAKNKVEGMGAKKRKAGRPRKGRGGGALFPAGNYGASD
jgi:hypothetical protein